MPATQPSSSAAAAGPSAATGTGSPAAKRPALIAAMHGMTGPLMDAATMNQFMYNLHYKVEAMEQWAATVNDAVTDHAVHIDNAKGKSVNAFRACATNESDTRKVMEMVQANDDALKAKIER